MNWSGSEILLYGGIIIIILAVILAIICFVGFVISGRKLKSKLEKEYGSPQRFNMKGK